MPKIYAYIFHIYIPYIIHTYGLGSWAEMEKEFYTTEQSTATLNCRGKKKLSIFSVTDFQKFPFENMNSSEQFSLSVHTVHQRGNV